MFGSGVPSYPPHLHNPRDDAPLRAVDVGTLHRVGLAGRGLAVREDRTIVALEHICCTRPRPRKAWVWEGERDGRGGSQWPNKRNEIRDARRDTCELADRESGVWRHTLDDRPRRVAVDVLLGRGEREDPVKREGCLPAAIHRHILARAIKMADHLTALRIDGARGDRRRQVEAKAANSVSMREGQRMSD